MKKTFLIYYFLLLIIQSNLSAQIPKKFATTFGGSGVDIGYSLLELKGSNYVYVGSSSSYESQNSDILLSKVDSLGFMIWKKNFGGSGLDIGKKVILNPLDSGFFIGGYSNSQVATGYDGICIRTDKFGNTIWQKNYGGQDWDFINDICLSASGDLFACGSTYSESNGLTDGYVCRIDTLNGNLKWQKKIGGPKTESFESIISATNGDIYLGGNVLTSNNVNRFWLIRMNTNGDTISTKVLGHAYGSDRFYSLIEDRKQNLMLCGSFDTSYAATGKKNISYALKTDLNGNIVTQFTLGAAGPDDRFMDVTCRKRTNDYFFSRSVLYGIQGTNTQPILFMDDFTYLASTTYGGFEIDEAFDVIETSDNGFAMIGYTKSYTEAKDENVYFIKLDSTLLNVQVIASLNEPNLQKPESLVISGRTAQIISKSGSNFYEVYSLNGQVLQKGSFIENKALINSSIPAGIYIFRYYDGRWLSRKFILTTLDE